LKRRPLGWELFDYVRTRAGTPLRRQILRLPFPLIHPEHCVVGRNMFFEGCHTENLPAISTLRENWIIIFAQ